MPFLAPLPPSLPPSDSVPPPDILRPLVDTTIPTSNSTATWLVHLLSLNTFHCLSPHKRSAPPLSATSTMPPTTLLTPRMESSSTSRTTTLALAISIPLGFAILAVAVLSFYFYQRRRRTTRDPTASNKSRSAIQLEEEGLMHSPVPRISTASNPQRSPPLQPSPPIQVQEMSELQQQTEPFITHTFAGSSIWSHSKFTFLLPSPHIHLKSPSGDSFFTPGSEPPTDAIGPNGERITGKGDGKIIYRHGRPTLEGYPDVVPYPMRWIADASAVDVNAAPDPHGPVSANVPSAATPAVPLVSPQVPQEVTGGPTRLEPRHQESHFINQGELPAPIVVSSDTDKAKARGPPPKPILRRVPNFPPLSIPQLAPNLSTGALTTNAVSNSDRTPRAAEQQHRVVVLQTPTALVESPSQLTASPSSPLSLDSTSLTTPMLAVPLHTPVSFPTTPHSPSPPPAPPLASGAERPGTSAQSSLSSSLRDSDPRSIVWLQALTQLRTRLRSNTTRTSHSHTQSQRHSGAPSSHAQSNSRSHSHQSSLSTEPDQSGRLTALGQLEGLEPASVRDRRDEAQKMDLTAALKAIKEGKLMSRSEALLVHRELAEAGLLDTPSSTTGSGDDHGGQIGLGLATNRQPSYANAEGPPSPSEESSTPSHVRAQFPFFDWRMGPNGYRFPSSIYDLDGDETPDSSSSQESEESDDDDAEMRTAELDRQRERTSRISEPVSAVSESFPAKSEEGSIEVDGKPAPDTL